MESLASLLRRLRTERGLSKSELAATAGVHRRTLTRWESGENQPSLVELRAVLNALGVTGEQQTPLIRQIAAPRARQRIPAEEYSVVVLGERVAPPVGGDLLRAMRLRRGRTQQDVAQQIGVTQAALTRWEGGKAWPSPTMLHTLCMALKARTEEIYALTVGRFSPATFLEADGRGGKIRAPEDLSERIREFRARKITNPFAPVSPDDDLEDLYTIASIAGLWELGCGRSERLRTPLITAYSDRARYLMDAGRLAEAESPAHIALELLRDLYNLTNAEHIRASLTATLALAERDVYGDGLSLDARRIKTLSATHPANARQRSRYRQGIRRLSDSTLQGETLWPYRTWAMAHIARYHYGAGDVSAAIHWAEQGYRAIAGHETEGDLDLWARRELWMRLLMQDSRLTEAAALMPVTSLSEIPAIDARFAAIPAFFVRAEVLHRLGERRDAAAQLRQIQAESAANQWPHFLAQAAALSARF